MYTALKIALTISLIFVGIMFLGMYLINHDVFKIGAFGFMFSTLIALILAIWS